jgi:HPt (histidine-containing phosphotransfer) domain-containing protein
MLREFTFDVTEYKQPREELGAADEPVDLRQIEALGGPDFAAEVLQVFYAEANAELRTMREAGAQDDASRLTQAAHALKGSSGAVGARRLVAFCRQLESAAQAHDLTPVPGLLDELEAEIERVGVFVAGYRGY